MGDGTNIQRKQARVLYFKSKPELPLDLTKNIKQMLPRKK